MPTIDMKNHKQQVLSLVRSCNSAREIEMLNIRPYVDKKDYCFNVFTCGFDQVFKKLFPSECSNEKCLFITSNGAHTATQKYLNVSEHYYAYITNTKTDVLDDFIDQCTDPGWMKKANTDYFKIQGMIREAQKKLEQIDDDPDGNPGDSAEVLRASIKRMEAELMNTFYINEAIVPEDVTVVIALGGGVAMDAGQYIATKLAAKWGKELIFICAPTVLSVNAAFCYKAAMRMPNDKHEYEVKYDSTLVQPDVLLVDPRIVLTAGELNVVGAGDLLSCLTASFDWKLNSLVARNYKPNGKPVNKPFNEEIYEGSRELIGLLAENIDNLNAMRDYAEETKKGKTFALTDILRLRAEAGLTFLLEAYHWVAEQSWIMQHTMWESASEHGMFDYMEYICGTEFTHGQIIGLCVYFMSFLQDNEHERAKKMIQRLKLDITLNDLAANSDNNYKVTPEKLRACLEGAKKYLTEESYRYTIISAKDMTKDWIDAALNKYYHDFPVDPYGKPNKGAEKYLSNSDVVLINPFTSEVYRWNKGNVEKI